MTTLPLLIYTNAWPAAPERDWHCPIAHQWWTLARRDSAVAALRNLFHPAHPIPMFTQGVAVLPLPEGRVGLAMLHPRRDRLQRPSFIAAVAGWIEPIEAAVVWSAMARALNSNSMSDQIAVNDTGPVTSALSRLEAAGKGWREMMAALSQNTGQWHTADGIELRVTTKEGTFGPVVAADIWSVWLAQHPAARRGFASLGTRVPPGFVVATVGDAPPVSPIVTGAALASGVFEPSPSRRWWLGWGVGVISVICGLGVAAVCSTLSPPPTPISKAGHTRLSIPANATPEQLTKLLADDVRQAIKDHPQWPEACVALSAMAEAERFSGVASFWRCVLDASRRDRFAPEPNAAPVSNETWRQFVSRVSHAAEWSTVAPVGVDGAQLFDIAADWLAIYNAWLERR